VNDPNPRRTGPHAPLPAGAVSSTMTPTPPSGVAAAVGAALSTPPPSPTPSPTPAPAPAPDDPRARAARRAAELREHGGGYQDDGEDKFYIDPRIIPDGWSYEWKRHTLLGKEDPSYQVSLAHKGWEAVPRSRHPEMMPDNYRGETIEREGQMLMERPMEITMEAKARELAKARGQVRDKEVQLGGAPPGQFERANKDAPLVKISKSYEAIPIPDK
jgi:hypothetical protein